MFYKKKFILVFLGGHAFIEGKIQSELFQGILPWEDLGGPEKDRKFVFLVDVQLLLGAFAWTFSKTGIACGFVVLSGQCPRRHLKFFSQSREGGYWSWCFASFSISRRCCLLEGPVAL